MLTIKESKYVSSKDNDTYYPRNSLDKSVNKKEDINISPSNFPEKSTNTKRPVGRPRKSLDIKQSRPRTAYNEFMSDTLKKLRSKHEGEGIKTTDFMKMAISEWKAHKDTLN